ncbi:ABC transporter ATP-binding protein [Paenibacillus hamazuiensis]|uniref:ABC transporter ATP-binding protein n=1 Tax=Paenibacillus hamazuiensis TaxID=2936508 RepID=UPI00200FC760|nr:ABC transporter ATP-binding protein [Paenibacillus hamazuiensis]
MLVLDKVTKSFAISASERIEVVSVDYFEMQRGEKAALVGPSGSGKSTLLHLIAGLFRPTSGSIRLLDKPVHGMKEAELDRFRAQHIGYVFQSFNLLSGFSALDNVLAAMKFGNVVPRKEQKERAAELLAQVGLGHRLDHKPSQLSGGEQQRVSIARALANSPALVLADEPTASLDADNAAQVFSLLVDACRSGGTALLMCTHDPELAGQLDKTINIRDLSFTGKSGVQNRVAHAHGLAQSR